MRAHFNLGMHYKNVGQIARATMHLQAFLRQVPSGTAADRARSTLAEISGAPQ